MAVIPIEDEQKRMQGVAPVMGRTTDYRPPVPDPVAQRMRRLQEQGMGAEVPSHAFVGQPEMGPIRTPTPTIATDDLTHSIVNRVLGRQDDYATRVAGRIQPPPVPVVPKPSLETQWGIVQDVSPEGRTRYTVPGEGVMTVEPETAATRLGDELARHGVLERARLEEALRQLPRGEDRPYTVTGIGGVRYTETPREAAMKQQRYEEAARELQLRRDLGLEPLVGHAAYEQATRRMREGVIPPEERAGIERARLGAVVDIEKGKSASEQAQAAASLKAQTEAAKLGLTAADVKSRMQLRQAQMDKMAAEAGLLEPMKLKLQAARDKAEQTKIKRDFYKAANTAIYEQATRGLRDQLNANIIDAATYNAEFNKLTQAFAARNDLIADLHPLEGQIHSSGKFVLRNGVWVDIPKERE